MDTLLALYRINSKSGHEKEIKQYIKEQIANINLTIEEDDFGNIFITKGLSDNYPCIAAHLDEVHFPHERNIRIDGDIIFATDKEGNHVGIGADDKNGIWIAMQLLQSEPILKVALFVQEEKDGDLIGCRGSKACSLDFFDNVKYIIQCDRKGASDVVTYSAKAEIRLCNDDFIPQTLLTRYSYTVNVGGSTDVVALKRRGLQIPCCNISCGYYNPHKPDEYTSWKDLQHSLAFTKDILRLL